ncbi:hypothetical protein [Collimonas antrihumi]|uniref:hypothetical protein n=1 Tax=Collimonas antrihumi TaxID=1940615 RepID=UPI001B8B128F|nr:hypothetical protein [Collimonas antrihumi]
MISGLLKGMSQRGINNEPERYALAAQAITLLERHHALELLDDAQMHGVQIALQRSASY